MCPRARELSKYDPAVPSSNEFATSESERESTAITKEQNNEKKKLPRLFSQHYPAMHVASAALPTVVGNIVSTTVRWWNQLVISDINNNSARRDTHAFYYSLIVNSYKRIAPRGLLHDVCVCVCGFLFLFLWCEWCFRPERHSCAADVSALRSTIFLRSNYKWVRFFCRVVFHSVHHPSSYPVSVPFCCAQRVTTVGLRRHMYKFPWKPFPQNNSFQFVLFGETKQSQNYMCFVMKYDRRSQRT